MVQVQSKAHKILKDSEQPVIFTAVACCNNQTSAANNSPKNSFQDVSNFKENWWKTSLIFHKPVTFDENPKLPSLERYLHMPHKDQGKYASQDHEWVPFQRGVPHHNSPIKLGNNVTVSTSNFL